MNVLIDTNVIVDVLMARQPFFADSSKVLDRAERGVFSGWVCATTITTIFYLVRRHLGATASRDKIEDLVSICGVATVNQSVIDGALGSPIGDFEDAVLDHSAQLVRENCIVTRNESDFSASNILIYSPTQFLSTLT